jgi:hypothetical protein
MVRWNVIEGEQGLNRLCQPRDNPKAKPVTLSVSGKLNRIEACSRGVCIPRKFSKKLGVPIYAGKSQHSSESPRNINLDPTSYGSFAEIGAGQEVARCFLVVGGASGTVAKSISAYDKEVSDDLYGSSARYVSKERLKPMLDSEWAQLINQLNKSH